jgi:hypothetical protein
VINDPPNWQALEVRFTDGTLLHFEFLTTQIQIKTKYMEARRGDPGTDPELWRALDRAREERSLRV